MAAYEDRAFASALARQRSIHDSILALKIERDLLVRRPREEASSRLPFTMEGCALSEHERNAFEAACRRKSSFAKLASLRAEASVAPLPMDVEERLNLSHFHPSAGATDSPPPAWLGSVCLHHEAFVQHGFKVEGTDGHSRCFAFLSAYQSPYLLALQELRERCLDYVAISFGGAGALLGAWDFDYEAVPEFVFSTSDMTDWQIGKVSVVPGLRRLRGGRVASHASPIALSDFLEALPPLAR